MAEIKRYLPKNFAGATDDFTQALFKGINDNDNYVERLVQACIDNLFLSTANGKYLVQLGEQAGFVMPANSGLDIRAYKVLVPLMSSSPKQIRQTINQALQAFYGNDRTRPSIVAAIAEPYSLTESDSLTVETEFGTATVNVLSSQVNDINNLTASELAAVLNTLQSFYSADVKLERGTNKRYLRLLAKSEGASSFLRIAGGTMQNVLQFSQVRETAQETGTTWRITKDSSYTDVLRFTWDGNETNPAIYQTEVGDIVTIRGLIDGVTLSSQLNGSFEITDSGYNYFVIKNPSFHSTINLTSLEAFSGFSYVDVVFPSAHDFVVGDKTNLLTSLSLYGITETQISGSYNIVASATNSGEAEIISATKLRVWTSGTALSSGTTTLSSPGITALIPTTISQSADNTLFFTSTKKSVLQDQFEYAVSSETTQNTATVTVPAIPPLAKRFLVGSAHLHGYEATVQEFTRTSITVTTPLGLEKPAANNNFVIANKQNRYDFRKASYKTTGKNSLDPTTYIVSATGEENSVLPYTQPYIIGSVIYARPDSEELTVTTAVPHGLVRGWGFTLANSTSFGNITNTQIDSEHIVERVLDAFTFVFKLKSAGNYIVFAGESCGSSFDIYRHNSERPDQADFYLEFPSVGAVTSSGLEVGSIVRLDPVAGTNLDPYYGVHLRYHDLRVVNISGTQVHVVAGFGVGPEGQVISGTLGVRSGYFGGTSLTYFFDQTSAHNTANVMSGLKTIFMAATEQVNPEYVGPYLYDPDGKRTTVTVSKIFANTTNQIFKGSNDNIVLVDKVKNVYKNEGFPSSGRVVIDYGGDNFEGPIRYIAVISNNSGPSQIILDPSYRFKNSHKKDTKIQLIHDSVPYRPGIVGEDLPFYITGTAQARNTLFALLELLVASGIFLETNVLLPQLKYQDPAIDPFS